jgi:pimeloyl-ACP methyl ester carboxylesterase
VPREGQIELPGGASVGWREWGDPAGAPVVFLHGTPGSRLFSPPPLETSSPGVRLITFDRPGYGRSTPPPVPALSLVADAVSGIADELALERFAVIGFSGGGPGALACGAHLQTRVSRVALVSSWGPVDEIHAAFDSLTAEEREILVAIRSDPAGAVQRLWAHGQWYADTPTRFLDGEIDPADQPVLGEAIVRANLAASNVEGARQAQAGLIADWVADALPWGFRLADVGVPVDIWVGERDPGRAPLDAAAIRQRLPRAAVHADPTAGHWLVVSHWAQIVSRAMA